MTYFDRSKVFLNKSLMFASSVVSVFFGLASCFALVRDCKHHECPQQPNLQRSVKGCKQIGSSDPFLLLDLVAEPDVLDFAGSIPADSQKEQSLQSISVGSVCDTCQLVRHKAIRSNAVERGFHSPLLLYPFSLMVETNLMTPLLQLSRCGLAVLRHAQPFQKMINLCNVQCALMSIVLTCDKK